MYFKGCENATKHSTRKEDDLYRSNYERIFGKKDVEFVGKQTYDDVTGEWVDHKEYKKTHPNKIPAFLIGGKRETNITLTKPNGDWRKGELTAYKSEKVLKMAYH